MARAIPALTREGLEGSASDDPLIVFAVVDHPDLIQKIRLVTDGVDYVLDGETYHKSYFLLDILTDDETPPRGRFRFPNVDRAAITMMRHVNGPPRVSLYVYSGSYWDITADPRTVLSGLTPTPAYAAERLFLTDITATAEEVEGTLRSWDYRQEAWPDKRATEDLLPGVFMR